MKKIVFFILLLCACSLSSQNLSEKQINKLGNLNIKTSQLNLNDSNIQKSLHRILVLDRKRKTNKIVGVVLSSISAGCVLSGVALLSNNDHPITDVIAGTMFVGGAVYGGISVPFWISAKNRKKERDRLMKLF